MDKKAGVLKILGFIFFIIILGIIIAIIYLYYFYAFKTIVVCLSAGEQDSRISCTSNQQCTDFFMQNASIKEKIKEVPDIFKEKINSIIEEAIRCDSTCKFKEIYGNFNSNIEKCKEGDKEFLYKIRGKEGLQILKYMKENSNS